MPDNIEKPENLRKKCQILFGHKKERLLAINLLAKNLGLPKKKLLRQSTETNFNIAIILSMEIQSLGAVDPFW